MDEPKLNVDIVRLSATLAELHVHIDCPADPSEKLSGTITGPYSAVTSTIIVSYPLRPMVVTTPTRRSAHIVIPEPNLWTDKTRNLYRIKVQCGEWSKTIEVGLKLGQVTS